MFEIHDIVYGNIQDMFVSKNNHSIDCYKKEKILNRKLTIYTAQDYRNNKKQPLMLVSKRIPDDVVRSLPHIVGCMFWEIVGSFQDKKNDSCYIVEPRADICMPENIPMAVRYFVIATLNRDYESLLVYHDEKISLAAKLTFGEHDTATDISKRMVAKEDVVNALADNYKKAEKILVEENIKRLKTLFDRDAAKLDFYDQPARMPIPGQLLSSFSEYGCDSITAGETFENLLYVSDRTATKNANAPLYRVEDTTSDLMLLLTGEDVVAAWDMFHLPMLQPVVNAHGQLALHMNWNLPGITVDVSNTCYGTRTSGHRSRVVVEYGESCVVVDCDIAVLQHSHPELCKSFCIDTGSILPIGNWTIENAPNQYNRYSMAHLCMQTSDGSSVHVSISMKDLELYMQHHPDCRCTNARISFSKKSVCVSV